MANFQMTRLVVVFFLIQILSASSVVSSVHNVVDFGANSGVSVDSTDAFLQAWNAACASKEPAIVLVPDGEFLIGVTLFSGPCQNEQIHFQIQGTIVAPIDDNKLMKSKVWIVFQSVNGLDISGGKIDARANSIWNCKTSNNNNNCQEGARSLDIIKGNNINIHGLTSMNSNQVHIEIENCNSVKVAGVNIVAPENSPNTDGIHIGRSTNVNITDSNISTGDDCISIGPGTTGLYVSNCNCGPGHGISIGSLGYYENQEDIVEDIRVESVLLSGTQNGVRIKTWGKASGGLVQDVTFHNITMQDVQNPIIIDQNYCPRGNCKTVPSNIKINQITYSDIKGTSSSETAIKLDCSSATPCQGISLVDISLTPSKGAGTTLQSSCNFVNGKSSGVIPHSCV